MGDIYLAPSVVVGIDGSTAAAYAAMWAVGEAVSRDIPLRLVHVIDPANLCGTDADHIQFASAWAALYHARPTVEATGEAVEIDTEVLSGKPLAKLAEESRSAALVCVGSIGIMHARHGKSSVATALPRLAHCPGSRNQTARRVARKQIGLTYRAS